MKQQTIKLLLFLLSLNAVQSPALAQSSRPIADTSTMTLDAILSTIRAGHPSMKMYAASIRAADEAAKGARSWAAPEIGTGFWMTPYDPSLWKRSADGSPGMGQYMISAQQMIPNKRELDANEKYLKAVSAADKESEKANLNDLYAAAEASYYDWLIARKKITVLDDNEKLLSFIIQSTEIRYKNNLGSLNAYYKAKAALGNLQNQRMQLENEITQQQVRLNTLMNRATQTRFNIDTTYMAKTYTLNADSTYFLQARSDIKAVQKNIDLTYLQQNLERTKLKPQFGISYYHMFGFGGFPMQFNLMATVRLPMAAWSSRSTKANIESLQWKAEALRQQQQGMITEATGQVIGLLAALDSKRQQVNLFQQNILPALQKNYQVLQLAYEQNTGQLFELLDAWQTLNMTQLEYLQQVQDLLTLQTELDKTIEQN